MGAACAGAQGGFLRIHAQARGTAARETPGLRGEPFKPGNKKKERRRAKGPPPPKPPVENLWKTGGKTLTPPHFSPNFPQLFHNFSTTFPQPKISPKSAPHLTLTCPFLVKTLDTTITTCYISNEVKKAPKHRRNRKWQK